MEVIICFAVVIKGTRKNGELVEVLIFLSIVINRRRTPNPNKFVLLVGDYNKLGQNSGTQIHYRFKPMLTIYSSDFMNQDHDIIA